MSWGIPEPLNIVVFSVLSLISIVLAKILLGRIVGGRGLKGQENFRFNTPDFSEIGVLVNNVRKLHEEIEDIKKTLAGGTNNSNVSNSSGVSESRLSAIQASLAPLEQVSTQLSALL